MGYIAINKSLIISMELQAQEKYPDVMLQVEYFDAKVELCHENVEMDNDLRC